MFFTTLVKVVVTSTKKEMTVPSCLRISILSDRCGGGVRKCAYFVIVFFVWQCLITHIALECTVYFNLTCNSKSFCLCIVSEWVREWLDYKNVSPCLEESLLFIYLSFHFYLVALNKVCLGSTDYPGTQYIDQACFELMVICQTQLSQYWDWRYALPHPVCVFIKFWVNFMLHG